MNNYIELLHEDTIEQFKGRKNINSFFEVVGKQLNDLYSFYLDLYEKRWIESAEGKQVDGIGDIVVLSRQEASIYENFTNDSPLNLDDETYKKWIKYKILKNTCNSTYNDLMITIGMFWRKECPEIKYSEDKRYPATIILDFDATKELKNQSFDIPFVKAGGVGIRMRMHKNDEASFYCGIALKRMRKIIVSCKDPVLEERYSYTDENDDYYSGKKDKVYRN